MTVPERLTTISIVVPVYSGEDYLRRLVESTLEIKTNWENGALPVRIVEMILVDDDARDNSPAIIDALAREYPWVTALHLSRNYGQHGATVAGILYSSGDWVATLDEDLQHPPARLPSLLAHAIRSRADVVYASPLSGVHRSRFRDWSSRGAKWLVQFVTANAHLSFANSFRFIRGETARCCASVAMHDSYFDVLLTWFTQRIVPLEMDLRDERYIRTGKSGYRWHTLLSHGWRLLFSSQIRVLQASTIFGAIIVVLSFAYGVGLTLAKIINPDSIVVAGWPSLMAVITFLGGSIIALLGIALQYISTLVLRAHGKPAFFVIDRSGDDVLLKHFPPVGP
ncbi:glycosyltransferase [Novosphingobium bradum]|uniref:Glycosyltransferase n=1 Tax=Novosphingobium bradum TaxID=1737444 RepID=A0ABV7IMT0_9SPHN